MHWKFAFSDLLECFCFGGTWLVSAANYFRRKESGPMLLVGFGAKLHKCAPIKHPAESLPGVNGYGISKPWRNT